MPRSGGELRDGLKVVVQRVPLGDGSMDEDEFIQPHVKVVLHADAQPLKRGDVSACNGGARLCEQVAHGSELTQLRRCGRSQVLVTVPTHLIIHPGLVPDSKLPQQDFDDKERLAYFVAEEARDSDSPWRAYWEVLPREFTTPLHYTDLELAMLSDAPTQYGHAGAIAIAAVWASVQTWD